MTLKLAHNLAYIFLSLIGSEATAESLKSIYETALKEDATLASASASYKADSEARAIARARILPQISASGSYTDSSYNQSSFNAYSVVDTKSDTTSHRYEINLTQPIFNLPAWYNFQRGSNLSESAKAQFASDQQEFILRVTQSYFDVLRAFDNNKTRKAEEKAIQRQLEQTRERYQVGLVPITEVHEAQAAFDEAAVNSLESRGAQRIAFDQLQILTGRRHEALFGLGDDFIASVPAPVETDAWVNFALENNFNLKVAKLTELAANNNAKAAKSEHLPELTLVAGYDRTDRDGSERGSQKFIGNDLGSSNAFGSESDGSSIRLSLQVPLFSGGMLHAQRRAATYLAISAKENFISTRRNIIQSARSMHQNVITDAARVGARNQSIISADSALKATQAGYEVGTRNIVDVLNAQQNVFRARRNYANARFDFIISMMRLKQVSGQLSPDDVYALNGWLRPSLLISR
ncbi:MAG: type I secretion protein TolC [Cellvibrionales bacterium TMED49]|nr:type I secretion protein TolC [Porticoccaceae bacterium]OUU37208.1 MAG: type I secretion protein TolC [Cellvibrionales bacterium TMED49]